MKKAFLYIISTLLLVTTSCSTNKPKLTEDNQNISEVQKQNIKNIIKQNNKVILRDKWGVPHIYGTTDRDAAYALAYANAEDDFITIQNTVLKSRGKFASIYGPGKDKINAILDYMVGLLKIQENVENNYNSDLSIETIELCEGYAAGINAYIEDNLDTIEEYIYPVSGKDVIAGTVHKTPFFFQLPLFLGDLYFKSPEEIPSYYTVGETLDKIKGSNVYAISPELTDDKSTLLAINSHQPFEGELAWYEAHINSKEGWNIVGGLFPGSPVILVGHNDSLGWGHTVNRPDILDIYELEINPDNAKQYKFDDEWLDFEEYDVNIDIKTIGKLMHKHTEPAFWSVHGPVIKGEKATYAIRYSNMNNISMIEQWYKMNKATNFNQWKKAMESISVPMFNSGYADKDGNIYYVYSAKIPIRNKNYNWQSVLPGNTSETLWDEYFTFDILPQILNPNSNFIQNCNSSPFQTTTGDSNPDSENFDHTFGIERHMTNRALRALETYGIDNSITYEEFKEYKYDLEYSKSSNMQKLVEMSIDILNDKTWNKFDNNIIEQSIKTLTQWDLRTNKENLNAAFPIIAFSKIQDVPVDKIKDSTIKNKLSESINFLIDNYGAINVKWGNINRIIRGNINLPLDGGPDIPRAIYTKEHTKGQRKATAGDCYILLAQWDKDGKVTSESIHQYGSATSNEKSHHFNDQVDLFSQNKLKPISINLDDIINSVTKITILDKDIN